MVRLILRGPDNSAQRITILRGCGLKVWHGNGDMV
jgi:hypothetical protein